MIFLTLPEALGTNTLTGIVFDKVLSSCTNNREAIIEALKQKFVIQIGFRKVADLPFIAGEVTKFTDFAWRDYGVRVDLTLV
jgi:hypothetical protein